MPSCAVLSPLVVLCAQDTLCLPDYPSLGGQLILFSVIFALPTPPVSVRIIIVQSFICHTADYYDLG